MVVHRPEYDMKIVGQNLRRLRMAKNLSVDDVREYLCLGSVQAIYKYETGKSYPQADTLFALMELYGAGIYDIIRDSRECGGADAHASAFAVRPVSDYRDHEEDEQSSSACFSGKNAAA